MVRSPEIGVIQSRENNKIWSAGENGVWGSIGLYLQHGDILGWGKEVGGHSVITFRQKLGQNHHIYQDNFYNSVKLTQTLQGRNVRVCSTVKANRGIPHDLEVEGRCLKKGQSLFHGKGDVMVQVWKVKRLVRMISAIHDSTIMNKGRKDRKTNVDIKKPYAVVQYSKFMKGIYRADQYHSYYSVLRKTVKWS